MSTKLPKHIAQMVEKNNLVLAIKTLAQEQDISMGEAKVIIDEHEEKLKNKQQQKVEAIAAKQDKRKPVKEANAAPSSNTNMENLNAGLDQHLQQIGYKKPLMPYWAKRVLIILIVTIALSLLFWRMMP